MLLRALEMVGARQHLAHKLGVHPEKLDRWLCGTDDTPDEVFAKAVDVVLEAAARTSSFGDTSTPH
jgi:DNA-binding transcriptional regulator YdaS (Cro superfamily)